MKKNAVVALIMSVMLIFCSCSTKDDTVSDVESNISSGMSSIESRVESGASEIESNISSDMSDIEDRDDEETSIPTVASAIAADAADFGDIENLENEKKGWGQGVQVDKFNRPLSGDVYQEKYGEYGGLFIMPNDDKKTMYLTFDEGYENGYTPVILDALKEKECPAVFFVTLPYVKSQPELIQRMIDEGHIVGNHSVKHLSMPTLSTQEQIDEIAGLHNYMVENFNYQMTLFRPPMGEWSTRSLYIAKQLGYTSVLWSYAYLDYDVEKQIGVEAAFPKVTNAAHNGAIYLLHAVSKDNAEMLGDVIDKFREDGYKLRPLDVAIWEMENGEGEKAEKAEKTETDVSSEDNISENYSSESEIEIE